MSSANWRDFVSEVDFGKSAVMILYNNGDVTVPCGTPLRWFLGLEMNESTWTLIERVRRKLLNQSRKGPSILSWESLYRSPVIQTEGKALERSRKIA